MAGGGTFAAGEVAQLIQTLSEDLFVTENDNYNALVDREPGRFNYYASQYNQNHRATRWYANAYGVNFDISSRDRIAPFFAICRAFWDLLKYCNDQMRTRPGTYQMESVMLYFAMKRPNDDNPNYNRLERRIAINPTILASLNTNARFNKTIMRFLKPHIAVLLAEENYADVIEFLESFRTMTDGVRILPEPGVRQTRNYTPVLQFSLEAVCQYNRTDNAVARDVRQYARDYNRRYIQGEERNARNRTWQNEQANRVEGARRAAEFGGGGKRKMFYHAGDIQFHEQLKSGLEDCLHLNPLTGGEYCFPMAFMLSQCRVQSFGEVSSDKLTLKALQKNISKTHENQHYLYIPVVSETPVRHNDFLLGTKELVLFNPRPTEDYVLWEQNAVYLHDYVEDTLKIGVDHTSWKECPQAYADCFQVCIHIFIDGQKGRFDVYHPKEKTSIARHIYMYCKEDHFHPVIDIRKFVNSVSRPFTHCDYCQRKFGFNGEAHIKECYNRWAFTSESCHDFLYKATQTQPFKPIISKQKVEEYCRAHSKFTCDCDNFELGNKVSERVYECKICKQVDTFDTFSYKHRCYFQKPVAKDRIDNSKLFVLDIESYQTICEANVNKYYHEFVVMCVRSVYDSTIRFEFNSVADFVSNCLENPQFKDATMIAHNGGGYDYQFLLKHMEANDLSYTYIPRPSSDHKYISFTMRFDTHNVNFIDFVCLIPGSLKGIAQSFQLEVQKGDFPHRFLTKDTLDYVGSLPPLESEKDYFSLQWKKSEKDVTEIKEWYLVQSGKYCTCEGVCSCMKAPWDCRKFLVEYCWLDVDVLADACKKYRDLLMMESTMTGNWKPTSIDPFNYLTQSQLAMQIFLSGFAELPKIGITLPRRRPNKNKKQYIWFHRLQQQYPTRKFIHFGTNSTEYYWARDEVFFDCYCPTTRTVYYFVSEKDEDSSMVEEYIEALEEKKRLNFIANYEVMYEYNLTDITEKELNLCNVSEDREFFYGGRTEVFSPYAKARIDEHIKYLDVTSLYPFICSFAMLPIGHPEIQFGDQCDLSRLDRTHQNPYFGYVRCKVIPNKRDLLGLLPGKLPCGKLVFDLNEKVGMWFTEEIYLAMENGYIITEIYEVHHFDEENRSDKLMRGYMEAFLTLKQEAEGWKKLGASSENPTEEEKDEVIQKVFESNGGIGRIDKAKVIKNPVLRQVSKIFLNCLWGKFCQRTKHEFFEELTSYQDYLAITTIPEYDNMTFRQMSAGRWRVKYSVPSDTLPPNKKYNIYLAAGVTAQARCYLHRQILKIGPERVLYCDTDSIIFLYHTDGKELTGIGLGKWADEYPGDRISDFMATAPKCYMLKIDDDTVVKAKGCVMSLQNQKKFNHEMVKSLLQNYCVQKYMDSITLSNFSIFTNTTDINYSYGTMFSRYNTKQIRCVLNKRQLVTEYDEDDVLGESIQRVSLLPEGYSTSPLSQSSSMENPL
jgi:hypothetical protein